MAEACVLTHCHSKESLFDKRGARWILLLCGKVGMPAPAGPPPDHPAGTFVGSRVADRPGANLKIRAFANF